jgi:hypothetical protein
LIKPFHRSGGIFLYAVYKRGKARNRRYTADGRFAAGFLPFVFHGFPMFRRFGQVAAVCLFCGCLTINIVLFSERQHPSSDTAAAGSAGEPADVSGFESSPLPEPSAANAAPAAASRSAPPALSPLTGTQHLLPEHTDPPESVPEKSNAEPAVPPESHSEEKPVIVPAGISPHPDAAAPVTATQFTPSVFSVSPAPSVPLPPAAKPHAGIVWEDTATVLEQPIRYDR